MSQFCEGLLAPIKGWKLILKRRDLAAVVVIPFSLSIAGAGLVIFLMWTSSGMIATWLSVAYMRMAPVDFLLEPLHWFSFPATTLFVLYFFYFIHVVVTQPFHLLLARRTRFGKEAKIQSWPSWLGTIVIKSIVFVAVGIMLFVGSFRPGLNLVLSLIAVLVMTCDVWSYELDFRGRTACTLGIALIYLISLILPGLTFFILPGAIVGVVANVKCSERPEALPAPT